MYMCVCMGFSVIVCVFLCLCMWACGCLSVSLQVYIFVLYECVCVCVFVLYEYVLVCVCVSACVRACNVHHVAHCVRGSPLCYDSPWGEHDLCLRLSQHFAKQENYENMKTNILPKKILNISERWKQLTKEARAKSSFKWLQLKGL